MTPEAAIKEAGQHYLPVIYRRIILALATKSMTRMQLAEHTKSEKKSIDAALRRLREWGLIYIEDWQRASKRTSNLTALWALGELKNEKRPEPISNAQKCRNYKARKTPPLVTLGIWNL